MAVKSVEHKPTKDSLPLKQGAISVGPAGAGLESFKPLKASKTPQLVLAVAGREKTGKTHLAYTFPEPIYHINFDRTAEPLIRFFPKKEIYVAQLQINADEDLSPERAGEMLREFLRVFNGAADQDHGTVVVDPMTTVWLLYQVFVLKKRLQDREAAARKRADSKEAQIYPFDWGDANLLYDNTILKQSKSKMNFVFINRASQDYNSSGQPTGKYSPSWQKDTPALCNLSIWMETRELRVPQGRKLASGKEVKLPDKVENQIMGRILDSGFDKAHKGVEIEYPSYDKLLTLAKGGLL